MNDYEALGQFYLGRHYDLAAGEIKPSKLLYDSRDLTTHAVCVGMTGSGKTGLCLSLLEEASLDGIPSIAIDPKGDLGNLLLAFPRLEPEDFLPWVDPTVAANKGLSPEQLAEQTAAAWREGLGKWDQNGERIGRYNGAVDQAIYTPGSSAGLPLTVLKSFNAPPAEIIADRDLFADRVQGAAASLLGLLGIDADPLQSREYILLSNVLTHAWQAGRDLDLAGLIHEIQRPPFERVGVIALETFFPADDRLKLGMQLNNLLASPSFASWLEGESLDVGRLLYTDAGQPRLSILSIAHLNDAERMFFVTILLNEVLAWVRSQPGTGSLRALLYMDEVYGFFPPTANPPSKRPMLTLLKQARAYGFGCVLSTQNPVDLDYKGLSNAGTWFLGRLQTERDKARVIEGLEGASLEANQTFNRAELEARLARLKGRVFLMNNVRESRPTAFHTRWAMSFLRGPLTRDQISRLMAARKAAASADETSDMGGSSHDAANPPSSPAMTPGPVVVPGAITQHYLRPEVPRPDGATLLYRPGLLARGRMHFVDRKFEIDQWLPVAAIRQVEEELPDAVWEQAELVDRLPEVAEEGGADAAYAQLPAELTREKNYRRWKNELEDTLYRRCRLAAYHCEVLDLRSRAEETEADFRIRMTQHAREVRDAEKDKVRSKFRAKIARQRDQVERAASYHQEQKSQFWSRLAETGFRVLEKIAGGSRRRLATGGFRQTMNERSQAARAELRLQQEEDELADLLAEEQAALEQLEIDYRVADLLVEQVEIRPRKGDLEVEEVVLAWYPWWNRSSASALAAWRPAEVRSFMDSPA